MSMQTIDPFAEAVHSTATVYHVTVERKRTGLSVITDVGDIAVYDNAGIGEFHPNCSGIIPQLHAVTLHRSKFFGLGCWGKGCERIGQVMHPVF